MKKLKLMILAMVILTTVSFAEEEQEKIYPLDVKVRAYPEEIRFGDICFFTFSVTNQGGETLFLPYGRSVLQHGGSSLYHEEKKILHYHHEYFSGRESPFIYDPPPPIFSGRPVKPGETVEFHIRMTWFPLPEFTHYEEEKELLRLVNQGEKDYRISFGLAYRNVWHLTERPRFDENNRPLSREDFPADELSFNEFIAKGYKFVRGGIDDNPQCFIRILPRPEEELKLLHEWYLELPTVVSRSRRWTMEHVFAHPLHVNGSPMKMDASTPQELAEKRRSVLVEYGAFFVPMETQTPESLARIERTNDLASQIIERSKHSDSTISQNMVEFIQLRGFLVDMRYAENERAEQAAFEKLMDFVDTARDKELWIRFLDEIGLYSIMHQTHFPSRKVEHYRELFARRFAKLQEQEKIK